MQEAVERWREADARRWEAEQEAHGDREGNNRIKLNRRKSFAQTATNERWTKTYIEALHTELQQRDEWHLHSGLRHSDEDQLEDRCWRWRMMESPSIWSD